MPFRVQVRDFLALLIVLGAAGAGLVVWANGTVTLGLTLMSDGETLRVHDVTPDGNAHRNYVSPGTPILEIITVDGSPVERGDPIVVSDEFHELMVFPMEVYGWEGVSPISLIEEDHRPPIEVVAPERIETIVFGGIEPEYGELYEFGTLERSVLESRLEQSIWLSAFGAVLGVIVWRLLALGVAGAVGRDRALMVGAAAAVPFLILPVLEAGTVAGIAAGYLVPLSLAALIGLSLARLHPDRQWVTTGTSGVVVAAALAAALVGRHLTAPGLASDDRGTILVMIAATALVPALTSSMAPGRSPRERGQLLSLALVPMATATLITQDIPSATVPIVLVAALLAWQLLPTDLVASAGAALARVRSRAGGATEPATELARSSGRDFLLYALLGVSVLIGLLAPVGGPFGYQPALGTWGVVVGVGLAGLVGFAVRRGFLGPTWTDAAVPLATAVGVPVILGSTASFDTSNPVPIILTALGALGTSHVLALRHTDPTWRERLFAASFVLVVLIAFFAWGAGQAVILFIWAVALIPGLPIAFADVPGEPRAITSRLETLAVALTPGFGATMLVPSVGILLLAAWLVAVVIWRQFTLNPLLGMAQRTQLQRDLAVAAAETERARLAADLHDDALQQLTMLVRTLDEGGQKAAADEAREVATKLRSVVGDLRLPILDDLGAGAALEWLVERVEPLAGGPVKLERSDEARPPANVELAVFRVAQEALTNAIKHGRAPIAVRYDVRSDGRVTLAVDDAGPGIGPDAAEEAPRQGHFGLANMQQRAEQIGALLDVRRWPAGGTRVALEWRPQ